MRGYSSQFVSLVCVWCVCVWCVCVHFLKPGAVIMLKFRSQQCLDSTLPCLNCVDFYKAAEKEIGVLRVHDESPS